METLGNDQETPTRIMATNKNAASCINNQSKIFLTVKRHFSDRIKKCTEVLK